MNDLHNAALTLHGLARADRRWLLARLTPATRERLEGVLADLRGLGMAAARAPLPAPASLTPAVPPVLSALDRVGAASAQQIAEALADEPLWLIGAVLGCADWPWRAQLIQRMPPAHRARLDVGGFATGGPAWRAALVDQLARRIAAIPAATAAPHGWRTRLADAWRRRSG